MKFLYVVLAISCMTLKAQEKKSPFSIGAFATADFTNNFTGGIDQNNPLYLGQIDLILEFNTEKARLWKGGVFTAHVLNNHGATPSAEFVGDLQVYSNIEAGNHTGLFELFYTQTIGKLAVKAGWNNLNSDFYWTNFGGLFLNSSFGISPAASLNVPVSIFPVTSPFAYAGYSISKTSVIQFATYAGNPGNFETNPYNVKWQINCRNGFMNILEYQYIKESNSYFGFKAGAYVHTADVVNLKDTMEECKNKLALYLIADKNLIPARKEGGKGLDAFLQFDVAPSNRCMINYYLGAGLSYRGFFTTEKVSDELGFAIAYMRISEFYKIPQAKSKQHETVLEFTYKINLFNHFYIQPDLQYIINPGVGINGNLANATVGSLRLVLLY
jgi:porin